MLPLLRLPKVQPAPSTVEAAVGTSPFPVAATAWQRTCAARSEASIEPCEITRKIRAVLSQRQTATDPRMVRKIRAGCPAIRCAPISSAFPRATLASSDEIGPGRGSMSQKTAARFPRASCLSTYPFSVSTLFPCSFQAGSAISTPPTVCSTSFSLHPGKMPDAAASAIAGREERMKRAFLLACHCACARGSDFPRDFLWGTAIAGFQVEMGCPTAPAPDCEDRASDWYAWITRPELLADASTHLAGTPPSGGPGFFELYPHDLDRASGELHSNALRLSIEWSRVFPVSTIGVQDLHSVASASALAYYHAVFAAMKARGLMPLVTLNHYTLPAWLHDAA